MQKYNNEDTNLQNEIAQSGDEAGIVPASLSLGSGRSESRTLADQLRQFTVIFKNYIIHYKPLESPSMELYCYVHVHFLQQEKKLQETKQRNSVIRLEKVNN